MHKSILILTIISIIVSANKDDIAYFGGWPKNTLKEEMPVPEIKFECSDSSALKKVGCNCHKNEDCESGKCFSSPRLGKYCMPNKGTIFPRFNLLDQYGESVDLYDFALQDRLIIIELSTAWCQPCRNLASWLTFGDLKVTQSRMWKNDYSVIKKLIEQDKVYFINIQVQDKFKDPSSIFSVEEWFQEYPDEKIAILSDGNYIVRDWMRATAYPTIIVLNEKMEIVKFSARGWHDAFDYLSAKEWN